MMVNILHESNTRSAVLVLCVFAQHGDLLEIALIIQQQVALSSADSKLNIISQQPQDNSDYHRGKVKQIAQLVRACLT